MKKKLDIFPSLISVSRAFKGILLDINGVLGNESGFQPNVKETLEELVSQRKVIGILSNSTGSALKTTQKFAAIGINQEEHFHFLLTSGEIARELIVKNELPFETPKKRYFVFGDVHPKFSHHDLIFKDTLFSETKKLSDADFIHISIPHINGKDETDPLLFLKEVEKLKGSRVPMLCINPDMFAHEGSPPRAVVRQGTIAAMYENMGGEVFYIGKPSKIVFSKAMGFFHDKRILEPREVLMVGDTPETDIRGAKSFEMASALVTTTGIMGERISQDGMRAINKLKENEIPDFFIERF